MNKKLLALLAALCLMVGCLAGCTGGKEPDEPEVIDYAGSVALDMESDSLKQEVTVKTYIDGDTTHFYVPTDVVDNGLLKARYIGVNTPESTGKIEAWGKKASNFTKEKLTGADSIIIESDDGNWNVDSTGGRYLVWVWYRTAGTDTYRNLNIELLQNGLSIASATGDNRYGETCLAALMYAKENGIHVHSKEKDPDFYYGEAIPVTLKGLRANIELYRDMKVAFEATITYNNSQTVYVEDYDAETDMYYGMNCYYGYNLTGTGLDILQVGNRVRFVGSVQYYEAGDSWQVSDIKYVDMRPTDPNNIQLISSGNKPSYREVSALEFASGVLEVDKLENLEDEEPAPQVVKFAQMALGTSLSFKNLTVIDIYTTTNEDSASKGAMTLTCRAEDGTIVSVRTVVLRDKNGDVITYEAYAGKTINVRGVVDCYQGQYQLKVFTPDDIEIVG